MTELERQGGLEDLDQDTAAWIDGAETNLSALTRKQRWDRARIRVRTDVPKVVKEVLAESAAAEGTSSNQFGAFLLAWGLWLYRAGDEALHQALGESKRTARTLAVDWDVEVPAKILEFLDSGAN